MELSKIVTTTLLLFCISTATHQASASRVDEHDHPKAQKPITLNSTKSFSEVEYIMGDYRHTQKLRIKRAGTYKLKLADRSARRSLKKLGVTLMRNKGGKVARLWGTGSVIFDAQPGLYNLTYFAKTYNPRKSGKFRVSLLPYGNKITPAEVPAPAAVPVPAAAWLFGSGLLGLAGIARRSV